MSPFQPFNRITQAKTCLAILLIQLFLQFATHLPVCAQSNTDAEFTTQYTSVTKKILLAGIELERFSLKFRLQGGKQPRFRRLRFFLAQEAGAAGGLAFEITGVNEFGKGRKRPLTIDKGKLEGSLTATMTTSIIAGSGSLLELASNGMQAWKNKRDGFDPKSANEFVLNKLKEIDALLAERAKIVAAHPEHPGYERAVIEGKILHEMRGAFVNEYSQFHTDTKAYRACQNIFFLLNASYNAVGATAAGVARKAVTKPELNGPANILFIVSGGMAMVTPILSTATGAYIKRRDRQAQKKLLNANPDFRLSELSEKRKLLAEMLPGAEGSLMPSLPATQRLAMYTESDELFRKQLENETKTMRHLEKVALQTSELGPPIGAMLMTQGILGTYGYYKYTTRPRKQITQYYRGAIVGTVGTSMAVAGNAAWLLASWSYEQRLKRKNQLPEQLLQQRLEHLDELETTVQAL